MTDHTPAPDPRDHDPDVAAAADRLVSDAGQVDTMAAMHRVTGDGGRAAWFRPAMLFGGLAVALLAVIGVFALVNDDDPETVVADGDQDEPVAHELDGTAWTLVIGDGPGGVVDPPDGWPVTISFEQDTFGGTASCNGYGGSFTLGDDGSITFAEVGSTAMGCEPAPMETEAAFLTALGAVESYEVTGNTLLLFGDTTELTFERQAPIPTAELVGQLWLLDTLIQGEAATSVSGDPATLLLNADGTLEGGTGCRSLSGTWVEAAGQIVFTSFAAEGNSCTPDLSDQDNLVVTVLGDGFVPTIDGTRLTVMSAGNEGLSYQAIDSAPDPGDRETLAEQLTGTSWSLLEGQGPTGPIISANPITIEFFDGGIEGGAPCNTFSATTVFEGAQIDLVPVLEGDQIEIFDIIRTEVACADLDAESEFFAALASISFVAVDGPEDDPTLRMFGGTVDTEITPGDSELIFERTGVDPGPETEPDLPPFPADSEFLLLLVNAPWQLVDTVGLGIDTTGVTLEFTDAGQFNGQAHCNAYGGTFGLRADVLTFGPVQAQEEGCDRSSDEAAYFAALEDVDLALIDDGGALVLTTSDGRQLSYVDTASLGPVSELDGTEWRFVDGPVEFVPSDSSISFFRGLRLSGRDSGCRPFSASYELVGTDVRILDLSVGQPGCEEPAVATSMLPTLRNADRLVISEDTLIIGAGQDELVFERVTEEPSPSAPVSVEELLDLRPDGLVLLEAQVVEYPDGTVLLCDQVRDSQPPQCAGRWVVVTNYNSLVDQQGPFTGVLRDDGRFQIVGPGSGVEQRGSGVDETGADRAILDELILGPTDFGALPWADEVELWLGTQVMEQRTAAQMLDPANWVFDVDDFAGFAGPFDIVAALELREAAPVLVGPHDHCAGPPLRLPESLWGLRQLSIQPTGIDSCIQWFAVDLFVNDAGQIEAVMLDLFGP